MKTLLVTPWIGEFGWELFCWQGYLRKISKEFDKVIVIGYKGKEYLYKDFADEYIDYNNIDFSKADSFMNNSVNNLEIKELVASIEHTNVVNPFNNGYNSRMNVDQLKKIGFFNQEFIKYKSDSLDKSYDILIHPRNRSIGSNRNWDKENWEELVDYLKDKYTIALIGNNETIKIDSIDDYRNISIEDTVSLFNRTKLVIGQSSGAMHLASLSGAEHFVWSDNSNYNRYITHWNPFNTKVHYYSLEGCNPEVDNIRDKIYKIL